VFGRQRGLVTLSFQGFGLEPVCVDIRRQSSLDLIFRHRVSRYDTRELSRYSDNFEPVSVEIRTGLFCTAACVAGKRIFDARDRAAKDLKTGESL
jgi:hypothetical protein